MKYKDAYHVRLAPATAHKPLTNSLLLMPLPHWTAQVLSDPAERKKYDDLRSGRSRYSSTSSWAGSASAGKGAGSRPAGVPAPCVDGAALPRRAPRGRSLRGVLPRPARRGQEQGRVLFAGGLSSGLGQRGLRFREEGKGGGVVVAPPPPRPACAAKKRPALRPQWLGVLLQSLAEKRRQVPALSSLPISRGRPPHHPEHLQVKSRRGSRAPQSLWEELGDLGSALGEELVEFLEESSGVKAADGKAPSPSSAGRGERLLGGAVPRFNG